MLERLRSHLNNKKSGGGQGGGSPGARERAGSGSRNKEGDSLLFITRYYSIKNTYLAKF